MVNKSIKSKFIIIITIVSLLFNFYLFKQNSEKHEMIMWNYKGKLQTANFRLLDSYGVTDKLISNEYDSSTVVKIMYRIKDNIQRASEELYEFGKYFDYTGETSISGFLSAAEYLRAYIYTVDDWIKAVEDKNNNSIPSIEDLGVFKKDLKNITDKIDNRFLRKKENNIYDYVIDDLTYEELSNIFSELVKETKSERVNYHLERVLTFPNNQR